MRSKEMHMQYLSLIEKGFQNNNPRFSTTYGINSRSPLLSLEGFDITKCLPYDIMHTVFEGVAQVHLQLLLSYLICTKKYFTEDQLNLALRTHKYGYSESSSRPSPIYKGANSEFHIKQSGIYKNSTIIHNIIIYVII